MSLLLDALKKAADDKKKNADENDSPDNQDAIDSLEITEPDHTPESHDSLELELDFEDTQPEEKSSPIEDKDAEEDDFPEVSKQITPPAPETETKDTDIDAETIEKDTDSRPIEPDFEDKPLDIEDVAPKPTDISDEAIETDANHVTTDSPESGKEYSEEQTADADTKAEQPSENNDKEIVFDTQKKAARHNQSRVENEQALSALINKSNKHSQKEKLKRNIMLIILIILILLGSGLYYLIEMDASSQDLYIVQNNSSTVLRNTDSRSLAVVPAKKTDNKASSEVMHTTPEPQAVTTQKQRAPTKQQITTTKAPEKNITKSISIVQTKKEDPVHMLLRDAYSAFHKQDYQRAQSLYEKVLKREKRNRDAILGLAAIAIKQERYEYARQRYSSLLRLNPKDTIATAGLTSIKHKSNAQLNESQLKFMLKEQPDAAHLYFALGALYSEQQKWPQAQSAFFSAWSAENKNADYAYNLAVSLDHLDKKSQAFDFYKLSIKLQQASSGNFSIENTQQRIRSLQENIK